MNQQPIIMEDARFVSNYVPNAFFEKKLQQQNNISSNEEYRQFLVNNATSIMNSNKKIALQQNVDIEFNKVLNKNHGPFVFDTIHSNKIPQGYESNETKQSYLSRAQLQALQFNKIKNVNV